ncbi:hypothetical protein OPQ81_005069 [Rhizoctonia solani]|nr:hypothetical protein OPQ81_005069 [Rhizoctonia solani]
MDFASDDEYNIEIEEEELDNQFSPEDPPANAHTAGSSQIDIFGTTGQAITPTFLFSFAHGCCEEFGIADGLKEDVLRTAKLPPQLLLVRLYARTVAFGKNVQTTKVDSFLTSREFKETITRRLQAGLLDPHITNYVEGTTARFVKHIVENPASYEISTAVQAQFMHSKSFSSAVGKVLSAFRGELQRKIMIEDTAIDHRLRGYWDACFATRHSRLSGDPRTSPPNCIFGKSGNKADALSSNKEKDNNKAEKDKSETKFWSYIDAKIAKLSKKPLKDRLSALERSLANDKRAFPPPKTGAPAMPSASMPEWQASVTRAVSTMESYQAPTPPVGTDPIPPFGAQANDTAVARSRPRMRQPSRETSAAPQPSTSPSSPINQPEIEEEDEGEEEARGPDIQPPRHKLPQHSTHAHASRAHASLPNGPSDMEIDSHYGTGQVSGGYTVALYCEKTVANYFYI